MLVHEAIEQAIAEEFVRLQGSTFQQLLAVSQAQSQALSGAIDIIAQEAGEAWTQAAETAAHHLFVTLRVNPNKPLAQVIAQPDVQAVLRRPFERATDETRQAISEAWQEGAAHGLAAANQDLQIMGLDPVGPVPLDQEPLAHLLDDAGANGDAAYQRFLNAIQTNDPVAVREALLHVGQNQALRARAGADVSGKSSASAMKDQVYEEAGLKYRKWVTSFSANTCGYCAALHGQRRRRGQPFGTTVWGGPLLRPPRHPNCRCRLAPWKPGIDEET
jgi:hypothetical protein